MEEFKRMNLIQRRKTAIEELDYDSFFNFLSMEGNIYINFNIQ